MPSLELFRGDITTLNVDAIVNADGPPYINNGDDALQLAKMYRGIFARAAEQSVRSLAIRTIASLPLDPAASIAVREAREAKVDRVIFVVFDDDVQSAYERALEGTTEWIAALNGPIKPKREIHRDGDWHVAAHIWLITPDRRVLLQRRSVEKENWPGYWDVSAAGHVSAGETPEEAAVRETFEELGVRITEDQLERIGVLREGSVLRDGAYIDREVHEIYAVRCEIGELTLQRGEVDDAKLVTIEELRSVQPLVPHEMEYRMVERFVELLSC